MNLSDGWWSMLLQRATVQKRTQQPATNQPQQLDAQKAAALHTFESSTFTCGYWIWIFFGRHQTDESGRVPAGRMAVSSRCIWTDGQGGRRSWTSWDLAAPRSSWKGRPLKPENVPRLKGDSSSTLTRDVLHNSILQWRREWALAAGQREERVEVTVSGRTLSGQWSQVPTYWNRNQQRKKKPWIWLPFLGF